MLMYFSGCVQIQSVSLWSNDLTNSSKVCANDETDNGGTFDIDSIVRTRICKAGSGVFISIKRNL